MADSQLNGRQARARRRTGSRQTGQEEHTLEGDLSNFFLALLDIL